MDPVLGALAIRLGAQAVPWIITQFAGKDPLLQEQERWAREGIMSPAQRQQLLASARGQAGGQAQAALRAGNVAMANRGLSGPVGNALAQRVATGLGSQLARTQANIELQNALTRQAGMQAWAAGREQAANRLAGQQQNWAAIGGQMAEAIFPQNIVQNPPQQTQASVTQQFLKQNPAAARAMTAKSVSDLTNFLNALIGGTENTTATAPDVQQGLQQNLANSLLTSDILSAIPSLE